MKESEFYQLAKRHLPHWTWDRIENTVSSGQPDTTICHGYVKRRIELKIVRSGKIWLEPSQISWATRMKNSDVVGDYVLSLDKDIPILTHFYDILDHAKSDRKKGKYFVNLPDILVHSIHGWTVIDQNLR